MRQLSALPVVICDLRAGSAVDAQDGMVRANRTALPCCNLLKDRIAQNICEVLRGVGTAMLGNFKRDELAGSRLCSREAIEAYRLAWLRVVDHQGRWSRESRKCNHDDADATQRENCLWVA